MAPLSIGANAPAIPGADLDQPRLVFFFKVTCPTCLMAAPVAERLRERHPEAFVAVGQDPPPDLEEFDRELDTSFASRADEPPYPLSDAYGIRTVPTLFLVEDGTVRDVVESWDRKGWNRVAAAMAERVGREPQPVSDAGDGLPPFRPG